MTGNSSALHLPVIKNTREITDFTSILSSRLSKKLTPCIKCRIPAGMEILQAGHKIRCHTNATRVMTNLNAHMPIRSTAGLISKNLEWCHSWAKKAALTDIYTGGKQELPGTLQG